MDALLLVVPRARAIGYTGGGDFALSSPFTGAAPLVRTDAACHPYVFTGIQILARSMFADTPDGPFSLGALYQRARLRRRLFGIVHQDRWFHVGTVPAVRETERLLTTGAATP